MSQSYWTAASETHLGRNKSFRATSKTRCVSSVRRIRQIDFQTKVFVHASLTRTFAGNLLGSEQYHIIQLNNRSVKDRSFSRKIESERSFFISEVHYIRWTSGKMNSMYSRKAILWRRYGMWR